MTSFSGQNITYDEIGNPLSYRDGWHFTWKNGRKLATAQKSGYTISYEYNADGLRTEKTVNGKTTKYDYEGSKLLGEQKEGVNLYYFYDSNGQMMGLRYNDVNYYPIRNLQGDVVALTDYNGNKVVEYVYDSWGKVESVTGNLKDTLGKDNPIRHRGYYYDEETGLYYLQSRYYDPATCRFINADSQLNFSSSLTGGNLFSYYYNNRVGMIDLDGQKPGDLFVRVDDVARDFAYYKNATSIKEKQEYSSYIYIVEKWEYIPRYYFTSYGLEVYYEVSHMRYYSYNEPEGGDEGSSYIPYAPSHLEQVGMIHSHSAYTRPVSI